MRIYFRLVDRAQALSEAERMNPLYCVILKALQASDITLEDIVAEIQKVPESPAWGFAPILAFLFSLVSAGRVAVAHDDPDDIAARTGLISKITITPGPGPKPEKT